MYGVRIPEFQFSVQTPGTSGWGETASGVVLYFGCVFSTLRFLSIPLSTIFIFSVSLLGDKTHSVLLFLRVHLRRRVEHDAMLHTEQVYLHTPQSPVAYGLATNLPCHNRHGNYERCDAIAQ